MVVQVEAAAEQSLFELTEAEAWTLEAAEAVEMALRPSGAAAEAALGSFLVAAGLTAVEDACLVELAAQSA